MSVFAIGDLHLSLAEGKPMDIFPGWDRYVPRLETAWRALVGAEDTVVVAGDISWAMRLEDTQEDFRFLESLPGKKLLMKGNHDYWWSTRAKMDRFFAQEGLGSLSILHNNAVRVGETLLCGSRGWLFEEAEDCDPLIVAREAGRIRRSLEAAEALEDPEAPGALEKVLFLHYPPIFGGQVQEPFFDLMEEFGVRRCFYGHLHGASTAGAFQKEYRGVRLRLISADFLGFAPLKLGSFTKIV